MQTSYMRLIAARATDRQGPPPLTPEALQKGFAGSRELGREQGAGHRGSFTQQRRIEL